MLRLEGCPKCKGAVALDRDRYGWYEQCLQCGYQRDLQVVAKAPHPVESERRVARHG